MAGLFRVGRGVLVGETTCASRNLHTLDASRPEAVRVIAHADAGVVFYGRARRGEVVHVDCFHQVGFVEHGRLAAALREACAAYGRDRDHDGLIPWVPSGLCAADLVDLQTATGGGRLTGRLCFGTGKGLRRAHLHHAHVACFLPDEGLDLIFWLVGAIEGEVRRQGLEIRRLETLEHEFLPGTGRLDMSPYATPSDSLIKGPGSPAGLPRGDGVEDAGRGRQHLVAPSLASLALELAGEFGTIEDLRRVLESLTGLGRSPGRAARTPPAHALSVLRPRGLVCDVSGVPSLTKAGWELYSALETGRRQLEAEFKRILRRRGRRYYSPGGRGRPASGGAGEGPRTRKEAQVPADGERLLALAVVPTVVAALARRAGGMQASAGGPGPAGQAAPFRVLPCDLRVPKAKQRRPVDVCLVLDGSASMAGRRLRAAKYLAQHLLLTSRDKVAVVVFQEREARVVAPFTRDFRLVERGLASIEPLGLTPLAEGLCVAADYALRTRRPGACLLLLTDGIPTVPKWGPYPMDDAKAAAAGLGRGRLKLVCIGLEPNRGFLTELAAAARGALYVVEELEAESLLRMVHSHPTLAARQR